MQRNRAELPAGRLLSRRNTSNSKQNSSYGKKLVDDSAADDLDCNFSVRFNLSAVPNSPIPKTVSQNTTRL